MISNSERFHTSPSYRKRFRRMGMFSIPGMLRRVTSRFSEIKPPRIMVSPLALAMIWIVMGQLIRQANVPMPRVQIAQQSAPAHWRRLQVQSLLARAQMLLFRIASLLEQAPLSVQQMPLQLVTTHQPTRTDQLPLEVIQVETVSGRKRQD